MSVMLSAVGDARQVSVGMGLRSELRNYDDQRQDDRATRMSLRSE
jgi:hypothetical protein